MSRKGSQTTNLKNFVRALELAKVDRDRVSLVVGHERGFTFRVYNPEGIDVAGLREVVEAVRYEGLTLPKGGNASIDSNLKRAQKKRI